MPNSEKLLAIKEAVADHFASRPNTKCAVLGCPMYRNDNWDKGYRTPAPKGWVCRAHRAMVEI